MPRPDLISQDRLQRQVPQANALAGAHTGVRRPLETADASHRSGLPATSTPHRLCGANHKSPNRRGALLRRGT